MKRSSSDMLIRVRAMELEAESICDDFREAFSKYGHDKNFRDTMHDSMKLMWALRDNLYNCCKELKRLEREKNKNAKKES